MKDGIAIKYATPVCRVTITEDSNFMHVVCRCGAVFSDRGKGMDERYKAWGQEHDGVHCLEVVPDRKIFWLSFCDSDRPKGDQFLGACILEVTKDEALAMLPEMFIRFPMAQPGGEWIAAASRKAHQLGCNPGGEMASAEVDPDAPELALYPLGKLMSKTELQAIAPVVNMDTGELA